VAAAAAVAGCRSSGVGCGNSSASSCRDIDGSWVQAAAVDAYQELVLCYGGSTGLRRRQQRWRPWQQQWEHFPELLSAAGFKLQRVITTKSLFSVMEAVPV
jgi:hypothetical protein